jgi:hypothetical protein
VPAEVRVEYRLRGMETDPGTYEAFVEAAHALRRAYGLPPTATASPAGWKGGPRTGWQVVRSTP